MDGKKTSLIKAAQSFEHSHMRRDQGAAVEGPRA